LNLYAGERPRDRLLAELIGELSLQDNDFRRWWADRDVHNHSSGHKRFHHPVVGDMTLRYDGLHPTGDPEQLLGLYTAEPGSPSAQALGLLASWTAAPASDMPADLT
jgi:hypothetical protein